MLTAIGDVLRGQIYVSRDLAMHAFRKSLATPQQKRAFGKRARYRLSFHILRPCLSVDRFRARQQKYRARALNLSVKTIETHRENIKRKLGLSSGRDLAERAIKFVDENFMPQKGETAAGRKKKVVLFRAA